MLWTRQGRLEVPAAHVNLVSEGRIVGDLETAASANLISGSCGLILSRACFAAWKFDVTLMRRVCLFAAAVRVVLKAPETAPAPAAAPASSAAAPPTSTTDAAPRTAPPAPPTRVAKVVVSRCSRRCALSSHVASIASFVTQHAEHGVVVVVLSAL
jgi:hypothetical protein